MKSPDGRECSKILRDRKIKLTGQKTSAVYLLNPTGRTIERVEVDDCVITVGRRCDWLIVMNDSISRAEIYVELKGSDILHAIKQIEATIKRLSADHTKGQKRSLVVLRQVPIERTVVQTTRQKFKRDFNSTFETIRHNAEVRL
jgi:hypothetical protein